MLPLVIDFDSFGIHQHYLGLPVQHGNTLLQEYRSDFVIVREVHKIFAGSELDCAPEIPGRATIHLGAEKLYPRIPRGILAANCLGTVGGTVVRYDDFEILERLGQDGIQRFVDVVVAVVHRNRNRYSWRVTVHFLLTSLSMRQHRRWHTSKYCRLACGTSKTRWGHRTKKAGGIAPIIFFLLLFVAP